MLLDTSGKPLLSKPDLDEQERQLKRAKDEMAAFAEWQRTFDGGVSISGLDAIGRGCITAIVQNLPYGAEGSYFTAMLSMLEREITRIVAEKGREARIRASVQKSNPQDQPS